MTAPLIRDEVIAAWRSILTRYGCDPTVVDAIVLELEQAAENRGARLPRHPKPVDPNAAGRQPPAAAVRPAHAHADYQAARAALRAPEPPPSAPTTDHLPPMPDDPQEPQP